MKRAETKLLAGGAALSEPQSDEQRKEADGLLSKARLRDYEAWLAALPVSKAERELIQIVDRIRHSLISGTGVPAKTAEALRLWSRKDWRGQKKKLIGLMVYGVHKFDGLPLSEGARGQNAFEVVGARFKPPLSASQVRKVCYDEKLPQKKKSRQLP